MEELQAKWTFDQGGFAKALIAPTPMGAGYHLHLVKFGKQSETIVLERQRGGWRVFKSIDAAANTANGIGFRRIEIDLSSRWAPTPHDKTPTPAPGITAAAHRGRAPAGRTGAVTPLAKILSIDLKPGKDQGPRAREKGGRNAPRSAGLSYLSLRFKIGEPSCLATLKMT